LTKKRKRPEHDDIDEMLGIGEDDEDQYQSKRPKKVETENKIAKFEKSSAKKPCSISENFKKIKNNSPVTTKTGNMILKVSENFLTFSVDL